MNWLFFFDLFGVFVFALSGGFDAAKYKLDMLGVIVLAVATGVGGGILRDILLGVTPPAVFIDERYLITCLFAALCVIFFAGRVKRHFEWVKFADAIGLGVFAAIGASKAIDAGIGWVGVLMLGTISAVGGGVIRDVLVREIPLVLRADFYASAAMLGVVSMLIASQFAISVQLQILISAVVASSARIIAMRFGISLPRVVH